MKSKATRGQGTHQERLILHYSRIASWLETRPWYRDNGVSNLVRSLMPRAPSRVLELCCGTGLLLESLSNAFPWAEFVGVDINPTMVEHARHRLASCSNVRLVQQNWVYGLSGEYEHGFDAIIVKNALHVLDNIATKLKELRRFAQPWTVLIVVETVSPNLDANKLVKRLFQITDSEELKKSFFTEKSLTGVLRDSGWLIAQSRPNHVRQYIETEDWLRARCKDEARLSSARKLLAQANRASVREEMEFDTRPGRVPTRMLRLQYVARHSPSPSVFRQETQQPTFTQLELL